MARHGRTFPFKAHTTQVLDPTPAPLPPVANQFTYQKAAEFRTNTIKRRIYPAHITPVKGTFSTTPAPHPIYVVQNAAEFNANNIRRQRQVHPAHVLPGILNGRYPPPVTATNAFDRRYSIFGARAIIRQRQGIFRRG